MSKKPTKKRHLPDNPEIPKKRGRGRPPKDPNSTEKCTYTKKKRPELVLQRFSSKRTTFTSILAEPLESEISVIERQKSMKPRQDVVDNVQQAHELQNVQEFNVEENFEKTSKSGENSSKPGENVVDNVQQPEDSSDSESDDDYIEEPSKKVTFRENEHGHVVSMMWLFQKSSEDVVDSEDVRNSEDIENSEGVMDSEDVENSGGFRDSEDIRDPEVVKDSEDVENSEGVKDSEDVENPQDVENSKDVNNSEDVVDSEGLENSDDVKDPDDVASFQVNLEGVTYSEDTENIQNLDDSDDFEYFEKLFGADDVKIQEFKNSEDVTNSDDRNLEKKVVAAPEGVDAKNSEIPEDLKDLEDVMIIKDFEYPEDVKNSEDIQLIDYIKDGSEDVKESGDVESIENAEKHEQMEILKDSEDVKLPEDVNNSDDVEILEVLQNPEGVRRPPIFRIHPKWYGDGLYRWSTKEEDKIVHKYTVKTNCAPRARSLAPNAQNAPNWLPSQHCAPRARSIAPSAQRASNLLLSTQSAPRARSLAPNAPKPFPREIVYDEDSDVDVETDDEQKWTDNDIDKGWELKKEEPDDYQYPGVDSESDDVIFIGEFDGGGNLVQRV